MFLQEHKTTSEQFVGQDKDQGQYKGLVDKIFFLLDWEIYGLKISLLIQIISNSTNIQYQCSLSYMTILLNIDWFEVKQVRYSNMNCGTWFKSECGTALLSHP